jgi:membrane dipeptidase
LRIFKGNINRKTKLLFGFLILLISLTFLVNCKSNKVEGVQDMNRVDSGSAKDTSNKIKTESKDSLKDLSDVFKLHYDATVIDTHNDFLYQTFKRGADLGKRENGIQSGLPRFKDGGVDMQVFAVWIPGSEEKRAFAFAIEQTERLKHFEKEYSDIFEIAYFYEDAVSVLSKKKFCGMMGIEDGAAVLNDIENVDKLYNAGIRYIGLTWNKSNRIGTSARDESEGRKSTGLTEFGKQVVKRMDEIGMLVDVSHSGENTFWDVVKNTKGPFIASHSNCYALNPHFRNLKDDQIKAIAERGGVIMINFLDDFINEGGKNTRVASYYSRYKSEIDKMYAESDGDMVVFNMKRYQFMKDNPIKGGTSLDDMIDHIDHIKALVGVDYIGLGSDFDGGIIPPNELYDATCYPLISARLYERGYTGEEIRKILGQNFLRVLKQVCSKN